MKKLSIALITLSAVLSLTACGKTTENDEISTDTSTSVSETSLAETSEISTEIPSDISSVDTESSTDISSEISSDIPTDISSEIPTDIPSDVQSSEPSTEAATGGMAKYVGDWTMNGGNGINIMHINEDGSVVRVSCMGEYYITYFSPSSDGIANIYNDYDAYSFDKNTLIDMAGYRYYKTENLVSDVNLYNYVGVWTMDGGAGVNTLHVFPNGTWHILSPYGQETNGKLTASEYGIVFADDYNNSMTYQGGMLIDTAGYSWEKISTSVF